jgi:hypothetical protein
MSRGAMNVVLALYRRTITPRGMLRGIENEQGGDEESAYGVDVAGYIGEVGYPTAVAALPGILRGEFLKDDRVADVLVASTTTTNTAGEIEILLGVTGVLYEDDLEFAFTLRATDVTVALLNPGAS